MYNRLSNLGVTHLYHFTDEGNVASIATHGLLSHQELTTRNLIKNVTCGGNDVSLQEDIATGMDKYVHLMFMTTYPMATPDREFQLLHVDLEVLNLPGVLFTNDISNGAGVPKYTSAQALNHLDIDAIYARNYNLPRVDDVDRWKSAARSEILVPKCIPLNLIKR